MKNKKTTWVFLLHKIWQILKRFSRALSWAQISYFWRVTCKKNILFFFADSAIHFLQIHQASSDDTSNDSGMDSSEIPSKIEEKTAENIPNNSLPLLGNNGHNNEQVAISPRASPKVS